VLDRVAGLVFLDGRVVAGGQPAVAEAGEVGGVERVAVVGVRRVTGGAAAGSVIAGVVVGAEEVERGVEEARLLQA